MPIESNIVNTTNKNEEKCWISVFFCSELDAKSSEDARNLDNVTMWQAEISSLY